MSKKIIKIMNTNGWILLSRKILEWEWWDIPYMVKLWLWLLMNANVEDTKWRGIVVKRGELATSIASICAATKLSTKQTRTALARLQQTGEIIIKTANKFSLITICNYASYQDFNIAQGQTKGKETANKGQTKGKETANKGQQYNNITINNKQYNNNSLSKKNKFFSDDCDNTREAEIPEISDSGVNPETLETPELEKEKNSAKKEKELSLLPCVVENKNLIKVGNESLDIVKFKNYFNEFAKRCGLAKIRDLTEERQEVLKARLKEVGKTGIMKVLENVSKSDFLLGRNERGWRADFDFIFRKSSFLQIWEGKYLTGQSLFKRETSKAAAAYNDELSEILHPELAERRKEIDNAITEQMWESGMT